jgi:glycosyltransferase involved in cell wall biosynthesis
MNILIMSEIFYPHGSGAELATYLYAEKLAKTGCDIVVITNRVGKEPQFSISGSIKTYRLPLIGNASDTKYAILKRLDLMFSGFVGRMVKWSDVVYIPRFWFSVVPMARKYGKPTIVHLHDYIPICPLSTMYNQSENNQCASGKMLSCVKCIYCFEETRGRRTVETFASCGLNLTLGRTLPKLVGLSDAVFCVSSFQRKLLIEREHLLREKTYVLYNPIPTSGFIENCGKDFGYFGGANYLKGFYTLCKAIARRKHLGLEEIRIHATKLKVETCLKQMVTDLGFVTYDKLDSEGFDRVYRQIQTVIVPSLWNEPWPYVVVEALVRERLLIASAVGGIPEQVEGCRGAFLFNAGDIDGLVQTLEIVRGLSHEQIADLGTQNREVFLRRFNNDSSIRKFIRICDQLA